MEFRSSLEWMEWASGVWNRQSGIAGSGMGWTEWNGMDRVEWDGQSGMGWTEWNGMDRVEWDGWMEWDGQSPEWEWEGGKTLETLEMDFVEI